MPFLKARCFHGRLVEVPVSSYVNVPTLESRLQCFNCSDAFYLGVPTVAYSPGQDWTESSWIQEFISGEQEVDVFGSIHSGSEGLTNWWGGWSKDTTGRTVC